MASSSRRSSRIGTRAAPRPPGTGSIQARLRADGSTSYFAVARVGKKQVWRKADSLGDAQHELNRLLNEVSAESPTGETPFAEFAERWLERFIARDRKPGTKDEYTRIVRRVLIPHLGRIRMAAVSRKDVQKMLDCRLNGEDGAPPVTPKTAMNEISVLRKILTDASDMNDIPTNRAWAGLEVPAHEPKKREPLNRREVALLMKATPEEHKALMMLLVYVGLRLGEALALEWRDWTPRDQLLHICRARSRGRNLTPKSEAGTRVLRLSPQMARALDRHKSAQSPQPSAALLLYGRRTSGDRSKDASPDPAKNPRGLMFTSRSGGYMDPSHWRKTVFQPILAEAGLDSITPPIVPHTLRHTAAVLQLRFNTMDRVRHTLGHNTIGITMDLYGRYSAGASPGPADALAGESRIGHTD